MSSPNDFNAQVIEEFRSNQGRVGGMFEGMPLLLLHHTGARSGEQRVNPVAYTTDDGRYVIIASKGGAPENPAWYHNLKANPDASVEIGEDSLQVRASEASDGERDRLYAAMAERMPQFAEYQRQTDRAIPVIVLTPR